MPSSRRQDRAFIYSEGRVGKYGKLSIPSSQTLLLPLLAVGHEVDLKPDHVRGQELVPVKNFTSTTARRAKLHSVEVVSYVT